ncbi:hypothetical protein FJW07_14160 [Mesorhizobium sp. B3-1-9]|uniref:hypothetical protein n=1 Tax=Mesorhizobium sp. B3-1-9 TaxID=2589892 RepID=UPI0011266240|nr:hypothetical protein [Mesorhizobium sp. B3-1-9]TPI39317.1 hypothetical protein FJW07_14160 [Mesorhizobium sp. B3-1-9]
MVDLANTIFRDFVTDGVPASGTNKPRKSKIREWGTWLESIVTAFTSNGGLIYGSKASMDADLAHGANSSAWVIGDATVANNGVYQKLGASGAGSWSRIADLPYSFIRATDAGAGTANAIQATTSLPLPAADGVALIALNIFRNNTGAATVSFNGAEALTIKTANGNDVSVDYLVAGAIISGYVSGTTFRLITEVGTAADKAAAEAAAVAAENAQAAAEAAAASIVNVPIYVSDLAALALVDQTLRKVAIVYDSGGKNGRFAWVSGNLSAFVAADTLRAIYVPPASAPTGASGCWVRQGDWAVYGANAEWGGYTTDYNDATGAGTENGSIIAAMLAISTVRHVKCPAGFAKMDGLVIPKNKTVSGVKPTLQTFLNSTAKPSTFTSGTVWCSRVAAVMGVSVGTITASGSGGTNGTGFSLAFTGGTGAGAAGTFDVSGGAVTGITITNGGNYTVAPSFSFASNAGLTGANISTVLRPTNELVRLSQHSGLKDVMLFWDNQPTPAAAWAPNNTPWAVRAGRFTDNARTDRAEKAWMEGVIALAFSYGIEFQRGGEGGYIRDCKWHAFKVGLSIDGVHHILMLDNVEAYPYWSVDSNVVLYMLDNYIAYEFGRIDGLRTKGGLFSIYTNVGVGFIPSRSYDFMGQPTYFADIDAIYSDSCTHGLMVYPGIVAVPVTGKIGHLIIHRTSQAGIAVVAASDYGFRLRGLCDLSVEKFEGSGSGFARPGGHGVATVSGARMTINYARICQWDTDAQSKPAFSFGVAGTHLTVKHVEFHNGASWWAPGVLRVFQGVTASGEDNIDTGKRMYIDGIGNAASKAVTINSTGQTLAASIPVKMVSAGFREFRVRMRVQAHATATSFTVRSGGNVGTITDVQTLAIAAATVDVDGNWKTINLTPTSEAEFGALVAVGTPGDATLTFERLGMEVR